MNIIQTRINLCSFNLSHDEPPNGPVNRIAVALMIATAAMLPCVAATAERARVADIEFIGSTTLATGTQFAGTEVGGLSGITFDARSNLYYVLSDDRGEVDSARFYSALIDVADGELGRGDVRFTGVTRLLDANIQPFAPGTIDPEGIALTRGGKLYISSEGAIAAGVDPFINRFDISGSQLEALRVPDQLLPGANGNKGVRDNLALESLTVTPDGRTLLTATENALAQDGPIATLENGSLSRIVQYNLNSGKPGAQFAYLVDPVPTSPVPPDDFANNGLSELLALDRSGTLLALERSFASGVGNGAKIYEVRLSGALNIKDEDSLVSEESGELLEIDPPAAKRLVLDLTTLGIKLDNLEGMTFEPTLPDGRKSLILVSDNNFSNSQKTQFLTFAVTLEAIPTALPALETPQVIDDDETDVRGVLVGDADDPAIWLHPGNPGSSLVIATLKDGGMAVFDLRGQVLQTILPASFGEIRYNNLDLIYDFELGAKMVDLAVASDRQNDTLAVYRIDPRPRRLIDVTSSLMPASIFGVDDGEATAYGLGTYTSRQSGKNYAFVTQASGNSVAQLELLERNGRVSARVVRKLTLPIPKGLELEDAQAEGLVADAALGQLYVGQEAFGIWKFDAEPNGSNLGLVVDSITGGNLQPDVEGLTIYYPGGDNGYLLTSSQGDNTFAVYAREGNNDYLGSFAIGKRGGIDSTEESDGAHVLNAGLGDHFSRGLLVVQDGANDPQVLVEDEGELENISTNFKFVPWQRVARAFPDPLEIDTVTFSPRAMSPDAP